MPSILDWSTTPISNGSSDSAINWRELQDPDTVNDSARQMMGRIAEWRDDKSAAGRTSTGSAGAYVISSTSSPDTLVNGFVVWFLPNHDNTGAATLKVNSFPAKPLRGKLNTALTGGEIVANVPTGAMYSSTNDEFLLLNSAFPVVEKGQEIAGAYNSGLRIGDIVLTLDTTAKSGRIRLIETTQAFDPVAYPELSEWLIAQGSPWGANTLPSAAGYFLRFAANDATVDPGGARTAGVTQNDALLAHTHDHGTLTGTTDNPGNHNHSITFSQGVANVETGGGAFQLSPSNTTTGNAGAHTHVVTMTGGDTGSTGGAENRPVNVAMHADIIASTSEANTDVYGVNGISYQFDTGTTDADPGSGQLRLNNATLASATEMYISETGKFGEDFAPYIATWDDVSTSTVRGTLKFFKVGNPAIFALYNVTGTNTDNGSYDTIALTHVTSDGTFADGDELSLQFTRTGAQGATGSAGGGIGYAWDTGTSDADPGSGNVRGNNGTLSSVTQFYISTTDANGADETTFIDSWDDSTSTRKGTLQLIESAAASNFQLYDVTAVTTASGYRKITVSHQSGNGSFDASDNISVVFVPGGEKGETGDAGANGADGTDPGYLYTFSTTTTDADPGAGYLRANNASLASATALYIDDADRNGNSHEAAILGWDDITNATLRGQLLISTPSDGAQVIFNITGASTDNAGYTALAVTYVSGATSFANDAQISVQFIPSGNDGAGAVDSVNGDTGVVTIKKLVDTNGVDAVLVGTTASAVNEVTATNAATGNAPSLSATGDDTNIGLGLAGKGSGSVTLNSTLSVDNSGNVSGIVNHTMTGYLDVSEISTPADPSANVARLYSADDGGTTKLYFRDSAGTETEIGAGAGTGENILLNGDGAINQRAASTSISDDNYGLDRWNVLTQANAVAVSTVSDAADGVPFLARITQSNASAQRFGAVQIVEAKNSKLHRSSTLTLSGKVRCSAATTIRWAILEWTGTADSVTSDVVLDWTSGTFTAGNFFLASSLTVTATGSESLSSATLTDLTLSGAVSSSCNNLIVMIWTDSTQAQNVTLDYRLKLETGASATAWNMRIDERHLCMRYYWNTYTDGSAPGTASANGSQAITSATTISGGVNIPVLFPVQMRTTPTVTVYNTNNGTAAQLTYYDGGANNIAASAASVNEKSLRIKNDATTSDGKLHEAHIVCAAEL